MIIHCFCSRFSLWLQSVFSSHGGEIQLIYKGFLEKLRSKSELQQATQRSRQAGICYKWQSMCATVLAHPVRRSASFVPNYISVMSDPPYFSPNHFPFHSSIFDLTISTLTIPFHHSLGYFSFDYSISLLLKSFHYFLSHFNFYIWPFQYW